MITKIRHYIMRRKVTRRLDEIIAYFLLVDLVEHAIKELTKIHGLDMRHILGDTFMAELKKRQIKTAKLVRVYMTVIRPLVNLKREESRIPSSDLGPEI